MLKKEDRLNEEDIRHAVYLHTGDLFESSRIFGYTKECFANSFNDINELYSENCPEDGLYFESQHEFFEYLLKVGFHYFYNEVVEGYASGDLDIYEDIRMLGEHEKLSKEVVFID